MVDERTPRELLDEIESVSGQLELATNARSDMVRRLREAIEERDLATQRAKLAEQMLSMTLMALKTLREVHGMASHLIGTTLSIVTTKLPDLPGPGQLPGSDKT